MNIKENLENIRRELPEGVELVAVSKFHPASAVLEAYEAGQRYFGESRVQEFLEKKQELPSDIKWHFIGHLQTNKVKYLIGQIWLIESVDSERLLDLIDSLSEKAGIKTRVLLQIHVAKEETKFGFYPDEILDFFKEGKYKRLKSTQICGIMGMASNTDNEERVRDDFRRIAKIYEEVKEKYGRDLEGFGILSMGMSGDWKLAVREGSDMVRIGSAIFGERSY